jgi:hypothetical protein
MWRRYNIDHLCYCGMVYTCGLHNFLESCVMLKVERRRAVIALPPDAHIVGIGDAIS